MYGIHGDEKDIRCIRQEREEVRVQISRNRLAKPRRSRALRGFGRELLLDAARVVALVSPYLKKKGAS